MVALVADVRLPKGLGGLQLLEEELRIGLCKEPHVGRGNVCDDKTEILGLEAQQFTRGRCDEVSAVAPLQPQNLLADASVGRVEADTVIQVVVRHLAGNQDPKLLGVGPGEEDVLLTEEGPLRDVEAHPGEAGAAHAKELTEHGQPRDAGRVERAAELLFERGRQQAEHLHVVFAEALLAEVVCLQEAPDLRPQITGQAVFEEVPPDEVLLLQLLGLAVAEVRHG
mmetsp:Transcript_78127/g.181276  ORF Transcript_78127/g.181276 Transcript_78127/m.181276 type:complete len:225 (-) Transcript_78127:1237-1911(-)